jgi:Domain of unknown function (DU1801)
MVSEVGFRGDFMAENKTKPTALSVPEFLDACPDEARRKDAKTLASLMRKVTGTQPAMWGPSIVGFDRYHYKYESGREGDSPLVGFSPRKTATVLYATIGFDGAEALLAKLGKHTTGKGCLYIKKLADVDIRVLETLVQEAVAATRAKGIKDAVRISI